MKLLYEKSHVKHSLPVKQLLAQKNHEKNKTGGYIEQRHYYVLTIREYIQQR